MAPNGFPLRKGTVVCARSKRRTRSNSVAAVGSGAIVWSAFSISFRLSGPDCLQDAGERIPTEARALGTVVSPRFSSEEVAQLQALAAARKDLQFAEFVDWITKP